MNQIAKVTAETEHKTIYAALAAAQAEMGKALKDTNNPHFKSKYADLSSVMDACMPALNKHGIAVFQPAYDDETGRYVKTILAHASGEMLECRVPLIVSKNDMQGYGSAVTYARRYGLMGMAGIAPEDDDGHAAAKAPPRQEDWTPPKPAPVLEPDAPTPAQIKEAVAYLEMAESLADLQTRWGKLTPEEKRDPTVSGAKEVAKRTLSQPPVKETEQVQY